MLTATYPILGWPPAPYLNTISSLAMPTSVFCSMYGPLWLPTVVYKMNRVAHCVFLPRSDTTASFVAWWGPIIWSGRQHHLISTPSSLAMPTSVLCSMYGPLWLPRWYIKWIERFTASSYLLGAILQRRSGLMRYGTPPKVRPSLHLAVAVAQFFCQLIIKLLKDIRYHNRKSDFSACSIHHCSHTPMSNSTYNSRDVDDSSAPLLCPATSEFGETWRKYSFPYPQRQLHLWQFFVGMGWQNSVHRSSSDDQSRLMMRYLCSIKWSSTPLVSIIY